MWCTDSRWGVRPTVSGFCLVHSSAFCLKYKTKMLSRSAQCFSSFSASEQQLWSHETVYFIATIPEDISATEWCSCRAMPCSTTHSIRLKDLLCPHWELDQVTDSAFLSTVRMPTSTDQCHVVMLHTSPVSHGTELDLLNAVISPCNGPQVLWLNFIPHQINAIGKTTSQRWQLPSTSCSLFRGKLFGWLETNVCFSN